MSCPYHNGHCAYPDWSPERCEICHCDWSKITAPATRTTTRPGVSKTGERITVEEIHYLSGYGELPANHFWRHALDLKRSEDDTARLAAKRASRKRSAA